jgi:diadenylate cyclase
MQQLLRWHSIADLLILTLSVYVALAWARQARALRLVLMLLALHAGSLLARHFEMLIAGWVLGAAAIVLLVVLVLAFQAEVRYAVMRLDSVLRLWPGPSTAGATRSDVVSEAAFNMAARRIGSLCVIVRGDTITELVHHGVSLGADISAELLEAIFHKESPLHDGATIVEGARVSRAAVFLPLTQETNVPPCFGTRHRAAMGLAERCDALVVVTSEERGDVTLIDGRAILRPSNPSQLASALERQPRTDDHIGGTARRVFLSDLRFKSIALSTAAVIWSTSFLLARTTVRSISMPVEFSNVPAHMKVSSQSPDWLDVQLRGNAWVMDSLSMSGLVAHFDLSGATQGVESIRVNSGNFNLPPGVVVDRVTPSSITLSLFRR